jgi:acetyl-CoA carboxylase carboxyltransferase component
MSAANGRLDKALLEKGLLEILSPMASVVVAIHVKANESVSAGQPLVTLEAMKMQTTVNAECAGSVLDVLVTAGETIQADVPLLKIQNQSTATPAASSSVQATATANPSLDNFYQRQNKTLDAGRDKAVTSRHNKGFRTARENLEDLIDTDSFNEYGQFAIAAMRGRRNPEELQTDTAADGVITGTATINGGQAAVAVNDYSVLAGTQGYFHHKKLDRIFEVARNKKLPVVMYTEGGGGRPNDTDVTTVIAGLNVTSFSEWAALSGVVPRIAVNNGRCFAGNAALFGCADIRIATKASSIGMAGPAMIEGGGLGRFKPEEVGPMDVQTRNGVVDILADNEAHATQLARQALSYFQGPSNEWQCNDQASLNTALPADRRFVYDVRSIINTLFDSDSFLELKPLYGSALITGFARLEGKPVAVLCNDCKHLGGAIDGEAAIKAARFLELCNSFQIPLVALGDTPGFMVGPDSEAQGAVSQVSELFIAGSKFTAPLVTVFLRKGYGLGAMAMAGGGFLRPTYTMSWPTGEFGAMGLEGAVKLGFAKELAAIENPQEREARFNELVAASYEMGKATEAAAFLELDAVIEPSQTRAYLVRALAAG